MRRLLVLLLTASAHCILQEEHLPPQLFSAATPAQIRFAEEMKYDDTGPGAKDPRNNLAYRTYKTLDEALIAYLNDPDTKLPENERAQAIESLNGLKSYPKGFIDPNGIEFTFPKFSESQTPRQVDISGIRSTYIQNDDVLKEMSSYQNPFRWQKLKEVRPYPVSISHYIRLDDLKRQAAAYDDLHDNTPKSAGIVSQALNSPYRGYYTYRDDSGQRTQHFTDDSKRYRYPYV